MQHFEEKNAKIREKFDSLKRSAPERFTQRLNLSWSNWGFGQERLADSAKRLASAGMSFIELHGNHYGPDMGYEVNETLRILGDYGIKVSGVCGMFSPECELSSNRPSHRQAVISYLQREVPFTEAVGGTYITTAPGAVGRPVAYDDMEFDRSAETLRSVAHLFQTHKVRAAIEPIRAAEVSLVHTVAEAKRYITAVNHPGVGHINGDVYHMENEEKHIGEALMEAGEMLTNLHFADSNRGVLGQGSLDVDTIIRALYVLGYNSDGKFVSFEPLGAGGDPYPAMYGRPDTAKLDALVTESIRYFRKREEAVLAQ